MQMKLTMTYTYPIPFLDKGLTENMAAVSYCLSLSILALHVRTISYSLGPNLKTN